MNNQQKFIIEEERDSLIYVIIAIMFIIFITIMIIVLVFLILIFSMSLISALDMNIVNPSATFRVNQSDKINFYIEVKNTNNFPINITIIPSEDLKIEFLDDLNFSLNINESKKVNYVITAKDNISTSISAMFEGNNERMGLSQSLKIIVNKDNNTKYIFYYIFVFIVILLIIIIIIMLFKSIFNRLKGGKNETNNKYFGDESAINYANINSSSSDFS